MFLTLLLYIQQMPKLERKKRRKKDAEIVSSYDVF